MTIGSLHGGATAITGGRGVWGGYPAGRAAHVGTERHTPMSDLNTTPLIDVLLVLLIMFIITIPPQNHQIAVTLPAGTTLPSDIDPVVNRLTIDRSGTTRWNGAEVDLVTLRARLAATRALRPEPELQFRPDATARYVLVDQTLGVIGRSGVTKLGFVGNESYGAF